MIKVHLAPKLFWNFHIPNMCCDQYSMHHHVFIRVQQSVKDHHACTLVLDFLEHSSQLYVVLSLPNDSSYCEEPFLNLLD